ncbi:MAG: CPBP family glutamic-type intramembrane protease [Granulosicoccaceae bacterium]|jgi:predicted Abi (CAAX) family protease
MLEYLKNNFIVGLKRSPLEAWRLSLLLLVVYSIAALAVGFGSGLFDVVLLESDLVYVLPLILFVFPSFLEEAVFRGMLIPNDARERGRRYIFKVTVSSSVIFVLWHPFNALTINPRAQAIFLDPAFLAVTFLLGLTSSLAYIFSRSLWTPVIIHWLTVLIWVYFLGGHNLVLT